jgi:hypothetical protein
MQTIIEYQSINPPLMVLLLKNVETKIITFLHNYCLKGCGFNVSKSREICFQKLCMIKKIQPKRNVVI